MSKQSEYEEAMLEIAFELTSIYNNYTNINSTKIAIKNLRNKLTKEYLSAERISLKVPTHQEEITVFWECPACKTNNTYSESRELVRYYDDCIKCGLAVDLIPE